MDKGAGTKVSGSVRPSVTHSHLAGAGPLALDALLLFNAYLGMGAVWGRPDT